MTASAVQLDAQKSKDFNIDFGGSTTKSFSNFTSIKPQLPDISSYVATNVTDFSTDGSATYSGNQVVPEISQTLYEIKIKLTNVTIIGPDKDGLGLGAGDIFVEGYANGNYSRWPSSGNELQINDDGSQLVSAELLVTKAFTYNVTFEVRDADTATPDDSFGFASLSPSTITNGTQTITTGTGEALLKFDISAIALPQVTAKQLLDGSRPYLYVDDETSATELPNDLVARVVVGNDNGKQAVVLQYFFYWNAEYSPDGGVYSFMLHKNDYEAFYIYYDLQNLGQPYRMVFNNYIYSQIPGFPNDNLLILETGATASEQTYTTTINSQLQLLLGVSTQQTVKIMPMSAINNWEYDTTLNRHTNAKMTSSIGTTTVQMTVDTSYHTFDLGPGGNEYGYAYTNTSALNDSRIKGWYAGIQDTFDNGTRNWSYVGIDIPEVGPFTFDVTQLFKAPYVITGYSSVSKDTAAIDRARNSYLNMTQSLDITIGYNFPSVLHMSYDDQISPGSTTMVQFTYEPSTNLEVSIGFTYHLQANLSFWLVQASFNQTINNTLTFDIDTAKVSSLADLLGLGSYSLEDQNLNSFLSLTGLTFYPRLFGTIMEGSVELDLWHIMDTLIRPTFPLAAVVLDAIGFFLDHFILSLDFALSGVVTIPLEINGSGITANATSLTFTEDTLTQWVKLTIPASLTQFEIGYNNASYGLNFAIDWVLNAGLKAPINSFVNDFSWTIGVFPDVTTSLKTADGSGSQIIELLTPSSSTTNTTPTPRAKDSPAAGAPVSFLAVIVALPVIVSIRRKYH